MNYKYPLGRYCLAAVLCPNPDHPRWKDAEFIGDEIHREIYTQRLYRTKAGAQRALEGNWGDCVSDAASYDCQSCDDIAGMYVDDVEVVVV